MSPDEAYLEKQVKAEEEKLQKKVQALSESDKKDIYEKGKLYANTNRRVAWHHHEKDACSSMGQKVVGYECEQSDG